MAGSGTGSETPDVICKDESGGDVLVSEKELTFIRSLLSAGNPDNAWRIFCGRQLTVSAAGLRLLMTHLPLDQPWTDFILNVVAYDFSKRDDDAALAQAPALAERLVTVYSTKVTVDDEEKLIFGLRGERGMALRNISDSPPKLLKTALKLAIADQRVGYYERYLNKRLNALQLLW